MSESTRQLIIDNSVLSSFSISGWFQDISVWCPDYDVLTSRRIWKREFKPHHNRPRPTWLSVKRANLSAIESRTVKIGDADWSLIALAQESTDPIIVTNDRKLISVSEERGFERIWGTKFLIQTFKTCGISEESFEAGLPDYTGDVLLPNDVISTLESAEKN